MSLFNKQRQIKISDDSEHIYRDSLNKINTEPIIKQIRVFGNPVTQLPSLLDGDDELSEIDLSAVHKNIDILYNDKKTL